MIITAISDTHSWDDIIKVPESDMLIHAGDLTNIGTKAEIIKTLKWLSSLPHKYKIFIGGNHDFFLDTNWKARTDIGQQRHGYRIKGTKEEIDKILSEFPTLIYLNDSGIEIEGLKIWGSPVQNWFHDWAFNRYGGEDINKHWNLIPRKDTDILVTHGPPFGILDKTTRGQYTGSSDLLRVIDDSNIKLTIFGHIHEARGFQKRDGKVFVNASSLDVNYEPFSKPYTMIDTKDWEVLNGKY